MSPTRILLAIALTAVLVAGGFGLYALGRAQGPHAATTPAMAIEAAPAGPLKAGAIDPATGRRILYYQDPMVPGRRFDAPGKSPYMDMALVPVLEDTPGATDAGSVRIDPQARQNLGLRTAEVVPGTLAAAVTAAGSIAYNERDQVVIQARAAGFVERLHVRATLDHVAAGQPLVELRLPDWVAAQEEFLSLRRSSAPDLAALVEGARQRLRQLGMSEAQIGHVEATGRVDARLTLVAPFAGVVVELAVRDGMTVAPGATLFRINGVSRVWAQADVPESQAATLRPGWRVEARSDALPGQRIEGRVQAILPEVNAATRTVKARVELPNPGGALVPGQFVTLSFATAAHPSALLVPTEALIPTGRRTLVMVDEGAGRYRPVTVQTGAEAGGRTEVLSGLVAGQHVVVSGQFLLDSEASIRGTQARLGDSAASAPAPASGARP